MSTTTDTRSKAEQPTEQPEPRAEQGGEAVPLATGAALAGVSVQALRQRVRRGTLQGVPVVVDGAIVQGIELSTLRDAYGELAEPDPLSAPEHSGATPQPEAEQPRSKPEQAAEQGGATSTEDDSEPDEPDAAAIVAVQAWGDTRTQLALVREDHAREVETLNRAAERSDAQTRSALRWGRAAMVALVLTVAGAGILVVQERDRAADAELEAVRSSLPAVERLAADLAATSERAARAESRADLAEQREEQLRRDVGLAVQAMTDVGVRLVAGR